MMVEGESERRRRGPGRAPPRRPPEPCACAWPGCECSGEYPAPRGRDQLRSYFWFCLDHVREYNLNWNYFAGMSQDQIEAHLRADVTWHRPTWRMSAGPAWEAGRVEDPFGFFADGDRPWPDRTPPKSTREKMMDVLGLKVGFTLSELKSRYKSLAKEHHPDLRGGDRSTEEQLKSIIEAYRYLLEHRAYA